MNLKIREQVFVRVPLHVFLHSDNASAHHNLDEVILLQPLSLSTHRMCSRSFINLPRLVQFRTFWRLLILRVAVSHRWLEGMQGQEILFSHGMEEWKGKGGKENLFLHWWPDTSTRSESHSAKALPDTQTFFSLIKTSKPHHTTHQANRARNYSLYRNNITVSRALYPTLKS